MKTENETLGIENEDDIVRARQLARRHALDMGFGLVDQTKIVTATSELARNALIYGGGGIMTCERLDTGSRQGIRITFRDEGPGIENIDLALTDGYTTGNGLGLGLGGSRRLMNDFEILSAPGKGTTVKVTRWR